MAEATDSQYFRLERFRSLVKRHLATHGRFDGTNLVVDAPHGGLLGFVGGRRNPALKVESAAGSIFHSGWEDLSVKVYRRDVFERAKAMAEGYEQLTQRSVTLVCYFEPDS